MWRKLNCNFPEMYYLVVTDEISDIIKCFKILASVPNFLFQPIISIILQDFNITWWGPLYLSSNYTLLCLSFPTFLPFSDTNVLNVSVSVGSIFQVIFGKFQPFFPQYLTIWIIVFLVTDDIRTEEIWQFPTSAGVFTISYPLYVHGTSLMTFTHCRLLPQKIFVGNLQFSHPILDFHYSIDILFRTSFKAIYQNWDKYRGPLCLQWPLDQLAWNSDFILLCFTL